MRLSESQKLGVAFIVGILVTYVYLTFVRRREVVGYEGFQAAAGTKTLPTCSDCGSSWPCPDHSGASGSGAMPTCPPMPDMSKYVLKTSIPPCQTCPDLSNYMPKTECPPVPDMSQYVLKSSIPKQGPIIIDTSSDMKSRCGECPPCPRPRCPEIKCPPPAVCPACPACPRPKCPETVVKCRAEETASHPVRPYLTPLGIPGFG